MPEPPKVGRGANFRCLVCEQVTPDSHIKAEGRAGRMDAQLMAIVAEGQRSRIYLAPTDEQDAIARSAQPTWGPEEELPTNPRWFSPPDYGMPRFRDLFTARQLVALTTFSDLVGEARQRVLRDAIAAGLPDDGIRLNVGGTGAPAYADAVATYLAFAVDRSVDRGSTICTWDSSPKMQALRDTFARQAIPMTWDFAEGNPFSASSGNWMNNIDWTSETVADLVPAATGVAKQLGATTAANGVAIPVISTDPPYYDNIGYADLADFFYVWLRRSLGSVYPDLFATVLTPKAAELVATPYRFGGDKRRAEQHFEHGLGEAFAHIRAKASASFPVTVYYAFKQAESEEDGKGGGAVASTGWETMLEGLLGGGFAIDGTWPMRSELGNRMLASGTNALASSIVLVCRPRPTDAGITDLRGFVAALQAELPGAIRTLQHGNIAAVDLAQAAIGPGMAVFSRYAKVVKADGEAMPVRAALGLINEALGAVLSEQEGEFDADTRWAIEWYKDHGLTDGPYGSAEVLSKAKNTAVGGMVEAGIIESRGGKVRLKARADLDSDWDPASDKRITVWEVTHHLIGALLDGGGEAAAADLLARVGGLGDSARDLAYHLFQIATDKKRADDALGYNALVTAWPELVKLAAQAQASRPAQLTTFG